jgi:hypothetical protein
MGNSSSKKIAILAWGSLIWDQRDLALAGDWQKAGPRALDRILARLR